MKTRIKYTVKYHPRPIKKVATTLFVFSGIVFLVFDLILIPFRSLPPELMALAIFYVIPEIVYDMNNVALMVLALGVVLWLFKWRAGKIELTEDKLIIDGSMPVSIWLKNLWEVDVYDVQVQMLFDKV